MSACRVDRSAETGSLVVCVCGFAVGPFMDHARAVEVARAHRAVHPERKPATQPKKSRTAEERRQRKNAQQREKRAAKRAAQDPPK